ncbi:DUF6236 family protein [Profundibacter amoris]|uniref:Uncharacterized protein n=1 Tax=Profundibacter amoris TaxID=2171755 RepID=A0A347UFS4_9RHOB|nr:DUF6236 family protein [Profundibacter amoris]AXX97702.1 hypothetical protein BAR1_07010 [Profundibacter amoris]
MLGSALYFPHIDIHDPAWLRSAILFWDEIQTIAPSAIEKPYQNEDSRACFEEGYLKPLRCDLHSGLIEDLGRKIFGLADRNNGFGRAIRQSENPAFDDLRSAESFAWEIEDAFHEVGMYPEKMSPEVKEMALRFGLARMHTGKVPPHMRRMMRDFEMARMHPEKMPHLMRNLFRNQPRMRDEDGDWLLVDGRFADAYMAALAAKLSQQLDISPLTPRQSAHGMSFRFMFDDVVDTSPNNATGAMLSVVMRGLRVDTSVPISKLLRFREERKDQYLDFAAQISELSDQLASQDDVINGWETFNKAQQLYEQKIEPSLRALKRELDGNSIATAWEGAYRAITVSVPSAGALAYFTDLGQPELLGAGAALAAADIGVRGYLAGRKARGDNPFSYLHDINANFGLPAFSDT